MANRERGEVSVTIDGTSYTLALSINEMCVLEEHFSTTLRDVTFQEILDKVAKGSFRHIRAVLWACFLKHQPKTTIDQIDELTRRAGGLQPFIDLVMGSLGLSMAPDPVDLKALGVGTNPRKAQRRKAAAGIGISSTGTGGVSH